MSRLGDEIRRRIGERESKELYSGYVETLGPGDSPEISTFQTKLSKLLSGNPEGERYFLEKPSRSSALEKTLGVDHGWLAAQRQVRVLVLDPGLPEKARAFLKRQ